jgi:hypothetical protein
MCSGPDVSGSLSRGVWLGLDGSPSIPAVGERGDLREGVGDAPPEVRRRPGDPEPGERPQIPQPSVHEEDRFVGART